MVIIKWDLALVFTADNQEFNNILRILLATLIFAKKEPRLLSNDFYLHFLRILQKKSFNLENVNKS